MNDLMFNLKSIRISVIFVDEMDQFQFTILVSYLPLQGFGGII